MAIQSFRQGPRFIGGAARDFAAGRQLAAFRLGGYKPATFPRKVMRGLLAKDQNDGG